MLTRASHSWGGSFFPVHAYLFQSYGRTARFWLFFYFALGGEFPTVDSGCCCIAVCLCFLSFPLTFFTSLGRWRWQNYCLLLNFCQTTKHSTKIAKQDVEFLVCGQVTAHSQLRRLMEACQGVHPCCKDNWPVLFVASDERAGRLEVCSLYCLCLWIWGDWLLSCVLYSRETAHSGEIITMPLCFGVLN